MKNSSTSKSVLYSLITALVLFSTVQFSKAQSIYKVVNSKESFIKVLGSSNVHDWTMTSATTDSQGDFKFEGDQLKSLTSFTFSVDAKSLKSEHSSMDDRTYKTIKAEQFPKIVFKLNSTTITELQKGKFLIKAKGDLTIAGTTQNITLDVTATVNPDNTITCTGAQKLQLRDYKIDPPSFMLGAMKVANDLTIKFNINYKK
ncbi:polyisoprenoid-binding protein YceI [Mucilaginibacter gracilis]|uniref:Polyisoprenoid-binding protein YceI n=1 Tax=Mucilaginibacter gracilis TaxID=423350 RepID=A0A495J3M6_9SPHI|nr:YceI family protein [Mucilaginibacter gracilis]RKR83585.1 polyisoprenoid-binding protein YceI [Mucilaginibacter gracilis]